jgi:hypothetical protein
MDKGWDSDLGIKKGFSVSKSGGSTNGGMPSRVDLVGFYPIAKPPLYIHAVSLEKERDQHEDQSNSDRQGDRPE